MKNIICFLIIWAVFMNGLLAQDCDCKPALDIRKQQRTNDRFDLSAALNTLQKEKAGTCPASYQEWLAESFFLRNQFDSATECLDKAYQLLSKTSCNEKSYYNYYRLMSSLNFSIGEFTKSLEYSLKALTLAEESEDPFEEAVCLLQVSQTFNKMKESGKGIEYARKVLDLLEKIKDPLEKATLFSRLSSVFFWRYQDTENAALLDSAKQLTRALLVICKEHQFTKLLQKGYNMMNGYAHETGDYKTALLYLDSSFYLSKAAGNMTLQATNYGDKADVMMEMKNFPEARRLADSCLILNKITGNPENIANAYALIYQISMRSEQYKDAVDAMNSYIEIQDSLTNAEKSKAINELEQKYNKSKNEKTIKELAQQKRIYILLAVAGLFALIGLTFFIRQQSLKNKQKIMETEQRLNRARMNPHFFFNALSSLQSFAMEGNDGKSIASNLSKFSHIMRETLESTYKEYVTIEQETAFLTEYLQLQKIRFPQKFSFQIHIADTIEPEYTLIPSMILQPFIENSIEHGFSGINYPGEINLNFEKVNTELQIKITDNGKGLSVTGKENSEHISRASQIIRDRIYLLNIKLKTKASFSIDNNGSGKGVVVLIKLPFIDKDKQGS
jgi:tetratricopeptide (TPR) repeat protein